MVGNYKEWLACNKEGLKEEFREMKANMKLDGAMDIPTFREWTKDQHRWLKEWG